MTPGNLAGIIIVGTMIGITIYGYMRLWLWDKRTKR